MPQTVLTDIERRAVGNLSIPRNVPDLTHQLRIDSNVPNVTEQDVAKLLTGLAKDGLVVNLGDGQEYESPGDLAAFADSHKTAVSMSDEKAQVYEKRLGVGHRAWRLVGDQWMFTKAGFEKLHDVDAVAPVTDPDVLRRLIAAEAARTTEVKDIAAPGASAAAILLPAEFKAWQKEVIAEFEDRTGIKVHPAVAGGAGYSDAWENLGVDAENGKASGFTITAPWFMALTTVAVTDADTGTTITEAGYTGYARKSVAAADMNTAASGSATNANAITFAACTAGTSTVIGFAKCIAATVGVMQKYGTVTSTVVSTTQTPATFAVAAFTTTLD
ncbi:MAG: hypothetical protein H0W81_06595 [Chloroflexi bacterium]|nr:hypothetical protein [Chloroflexota bacterium]